MLRQQTSAGVRIQKQQPEELSCQLNTHPPLSPCVTVTQTKSSSYEFAWGACFAGYAESSQEGSEYEEGDDNGEESGEGESVSMQGL